MTCVDTIDRKPPHSEQASRSVHPMASPPIVINFNRQITLSPNLVDEAWDNLSLNTRAQSYFALPSVMHRSFIAGLSRSKRLRAKFG